MKLATLNRTVTLMGRLLDRRHSTVPFVTPEQTKTAFSADCAGAPLPRVTPESQGLCSRDIAAFFRALQRDETLNMHSVTVLRHGKILAQATFGDQDAAVWRATFSACKSVVSLAVGLAVDEGLLQVSDRATDFFEPELNPIARLKLRELRVEDLLTMRSGVTFNEAEAMCEEDWIRGFLNAPVRGTIGKTFHYNSLNTYMLAAIVRRVTGKGLCDYLRPRLFDPLSIGEVFWETCPHGIEKGGWGLFIRPEDLAKFGQLVLQRGMWQGTRLLSEDWIAAATDTHAEAPVDYGDYHYGYQIWTGRTDHRFLFNGMLGQNVMGFFDNDVLLVSHAGNDEMFQQSRYFPLAHAAFGKAFPPSLPEDAAAQRELCEVTASLRTSYPTPPRRTLLDRLRRREVLPLPALCYRLNGAAFTVEKAEDAASVGLLPVSIQAINNRYTAGLRRLHFAVEGDAFVLFYEEAGDIHRVPVGFYAAERVTLTFCGDPYFVAVSGRCTVDEEERPVLLLRVSFLETPYVRQLKLTLMGDALQLEQEERPGDSFVWLLVDSTLSDFEKQRLVGSALQKIDLDYFHYKTERLFSPRVTLRREH